MELTFETLITELTRDANSARPQDTLRWCLNWFQQRLEGQVARPPAYPTSLPEDHFTDTPIQSNRRPAENPAAEVVSPYSRFPPGYRPHLAKLRGPRPVGTLKVLGSTFEDTENLLAPLPTTLNSGQYSTHQNTSHNPAPGRSSQRTTSSMIFVRRTPVSTGSTVINSETTYPPPGFPGTAEQFGRARHSITKGFIFRHLNEDQETRVLNAMQEMGVAANGIVINQGDAGEYFSIVESGHSNYHTRPRQPPQPSPTSFPSEWEFPQPDSLAVRSPGSSSGPLVLRPIANSFIDQRLLYGVSLGFNPPQISSIKTMFEGVVPNVISLPPGRFVPFHIQAPDWRHLLKTMARLSGTRVEASIEAIAETEQELKLRAVVQFVRVSPKSQDWRTILYLTIDNPPPSNAPQKFTNGDVDTLPFGYSASPLPVLLRDGPDGPMSSYYTIPATPNTPYPTLPISFPNLAAYLASAVEDSRGVPQDDRSGMNRLAKTLDTLYPAGVESGSEDNVDQRRNDSYADLVTPFVPEWG